MEPASAGSQAAPTPRCYMAIRITFILVVAAWLTAAMMLSTADLRGCRVKHGLETCLTTLNR